MKIINKKVLAEFSGRGICEICKTFAKRDCHHVRARGMAGGHRLDVRCNLVAICREDHSRMDTRDGSRLCLSIIAKRELQSVDVIEAVHRFLTRLDKDISPFKLEEALMNLPSHVQRIARRELKEVGFA